MRVSDNRRLLVLSTLSGGAGLLAQTLLLRAFLIIAHGHEGVLGAGLAAWLLWTALGSAAAGRWPPQPECTTVRLARLLRTLALLLPLTLAYFNRARGLWAIPPGELLSLTQAVSMVGLGLAPLGMVNGALFTSVCAISNRGQHPSGTVSRVYTGEALGAGLAGLVFTFFLVGRIDAEPTALAMGLILLAVAFCLEGKRRWWMSLIATISLAGLCFWAATLSREALPGAQSSKRIRRTTPYQEIAAVNLRGQTTFFQNGLPALTVPDILADEETAHPPLLAHPAPETALFIGGTVTGTMREALKHPTLQTATCVETDPLYLSLILARGETPEPNGNRAEYIAQDARRFLGETDRHYDVIAQTLPLPITAQMNRFYTVEWFRLIAHHLSEDGRFTLALPAAENALNPEMRAFVQLVDGSLGAVFPHVQALPGETIFLVASGKEGVPLTEQWIVQRMKARSLSVQYLREDYWAARLDSLRVTQLAQAVSGETRSINRDFNAQGLFRAMALWQSRFPAVSANRWNRLWPLTGLLLALGIIIPVYRADARSGTLFWRPLSLAVLVLGFTEMALQLFLLFTYQVLSGDAYAHLALIMAAYMAGLTLGGTLSPRLQRTEPDLWKPLLRIQGAMALWPVLFFLILKGLEIGTLPHAVVTVIFSGMALTAGVLGGLQFSLVNRLASRHVQRALQAVGGLYALDLAGAMAGALLATSVLLPRLGLPGSLALLTGLNLLAVGALHQTKTKARS